MKKRRTGVLGFRSWQPRYALLYPDQLLLLEKSSEKGGKAKEVLLKVSRLVGLHVFQCMQACVFEDARALCLHPRHSCGHQYASVGSICVSISIQRAIFLPDKRKGNRFDVIAVNGDVWSFDCDTPLLAKLWVTRINSVCVPAQLGAMGFNHPAAFVSSCTPLRSLRSRVYSPCAMLSAGAQAVRRAARL